MRMGDFSLDFLGKLGGEQTSSFGGNEGKGSGHTLGFSLTGNYVVSPNFVVDANFGITRQVSDSQELDLNQD